VRFLDLQPVERLGDLLGLADVHLLPQRADAADLVMPSKLTGMLSSGRPVVAGARPETELGRVASQCGIAVAPDDARAFADAVLTLASQPALRQELSLRARAFAEANFDRNAVLARFEQDLEACIRRTTTTGAGEARL
jgi:colanic acid biosynthesis glycosyl transferase WcaI